MSVRQLSKRILAMTLCLAMLLGSIPTALAEEEQYDGGKKQGFLQRIDQVDEVPEGYTGIYTVADMRALTDEKASGDYILMQDLNLGELEPLRSGGGQFEGTLDGNGHTVSYTIRCTVGAKTTMDLGLFPMVTGRVSNLRVTGSMDVTYDRPLSSNVTAGGVAGRLGAVGVVGSVTNCVSEVEIRIEAGDGAFLNEEGVGGIAGILYNDSSVYYCRNRGSVNGYCGVGGIVGRAQYSGQKGAAVFACLNEGSVKCGIKGGGIVGRTYKQSRLMIQSCANTASVTAKETAGGILGEGAVNSTVADSLNTGAISSTQAPCYAGGIVGDGVSVKYTRCVNTGTVKAVRSGSISGRIGAVSDVSHCYWLDSGKQQYCELGYSGVDSGDRTGARSAASLTVQDDYETYDFEKLWVMDADLGCAYPLPLVWMDYDNTYKLSTEARKNERFEKCLSLQSYLDSAGGPNGGAASILHQTYQKAHLHIVNNGWKFIKQLNKLAGLDLSGENSFELVLTDLLYQNYGMEVYEDMASEKILSNCSDFFTGMEAFMDVADAKEVQDIMAEVAKKGSVFAPSMGSLVSKMVGALKKTDLGKYAGAGAEFVGSAYSVVSTGVHSVNELEKEMNKYVLYNTHADISNSYAQLLRDMRGKLSAATAGDLEKQWADEALDSLAFQLTQATNSDPSAMYFHAGQDMMNFFSQEAKNTVDIFYGETLKGLPVLAGVELGLKLGVPIANKFTKMDNVSYYGGMMDCAGTLAEALYPVVKDRMAAFRAKGDYDSMAALKEAMELYFALQMLACDYGIGYNNAIMSAPLAMDSLTMDEEASAIQLLVYKVELEKTRNSARSMLTQSDDLTGYVVSCPVSVHVAGKDGAPVAVQSTGSQSVDSTVPECFQLLGEEAEAKAGLYNENTQNMWIEGDDSGVMDLLLYHSNAGGFSGFELFLDLPVEDGCIYTFEDGRAILDGEEMFDPVDRLYNPFVDIKYGAYYFSPVLWAVEHEPQITNGTDPTHFSPSATCTRAQVVTFLWRAAGCPAPAMTRNPFVDVKETAFYYKALLWAVEHGITNGIDATHFGPDKGCTRGQVVTFLWRAEQQPSPGSSVNPFRDVQKGKFYYNAVLWAVENKITNGMSPTAFAPDATCQRGQVVTFLYRATQGK